jgi:hypothetical protein
MMSNERKLELNDTLLERSGSFARLWTYSASHAELQIRIETTGRSGNVHLVCDGCKRIEAPVAWQNARIEFVQCENGNDELGRYELLDTQAGFRVRCNLIRIFRDVEPVF